jgi:integration host factor subunit beta
MRIAAMRRSPAFTRFVYDEPIELFGDNGIILTLARDQVPEEHGSYAPVYQSYALISHTHLPGAWKMTDKTETLTKKDVARRVAELMDEPIYKSEPWVNAVIAAMGQLMLEADPEIRIELRDFGVFEVKKTKAKPKARNPKTNETVFIPSRRKTHFKPSKRLKQVLQMPLNDLEYHIHNGSVELEENTPLLVNNGYH